MCGQSWSHMKGFMRTRGGEGKGESQPIPRLAPRLREIPPPLPAPARAPPLLPQRPCGQVHTSSLALMVSVVTSSNPRDWGVSEGGAVGQAALCLQR